MPEHTMTVTDRRYIRVVKVVAGAMQPADPLGLEAPLEPGARLSRSDLAGERALPAVQHHPLPRGDLAQRLRRGRATAFTGGTIYPSHSSRAEMWTAREERESIIRAVLKRAADPADYLDASDGERAVAAAALVVGQPTGNG
ncbi:DUF4259 domain-containing protein [Streptomyces anulatus]|uniref:DUF4259 domain-containing protein n=1 Tax=Streptomyces anulatus TaxID=1892 RepID=UPI0035D84CF9